MKRVSYRRFQAVGQGHMARVCAGVIFAVLVGWSLLVIGSEADEPTQWLFDPEHSDIRFKLAALGVVPIHGSFQRFSGRVWRHEKDGLLRVEIRIDAESLTMKSERYRDWARSPEFFHVRRHPEIVFRSEPIEHGLLSRGGELSGWLTLRGIESAARFQLAASSCASASKGCELRVTGEVNRRRFGMRTRRMTLSSHVRLNMRFWVIPVPQVVSTPSF